MTGIALAIVLGMSFSSIAGLFSKDPEVLQIVRKGVLVSGVFSYIKLSGLRGFDSESTHL